MNNKNMNETDLVEVVQKVEKTLSEILLVLNEIKKDLVENKERKRQEEYEENLKKKNFLLG